MVLTISLLSLPCHGIQHEGKKIRNSHINVDKWLKVQSQIYTVLYKSTGASLKKEL